MDERMKFDENIGQRKMKKKVATLIGSAKMFPVL
jgi:hypothetical protein